MKGMRLSIRVVIAIIVVFAVLGAVLYANTPAMLQTLSERKAQSGDMERAILLRKRIVTYFPWSETARRTLLDWANAYADGNGRFYITQNGNGGGSFSPLSPEELIQKLHYFYKEDLSDWRDRETAITAAKLYERIKDYYKAVEIYKTALDADKKQENNSLYAQDIKSLSAVYAEMGKREEAIALLKGNIENAAVWQKAEYYEALGDLLTQDGSYEEAEKAYSLCLEAKADMEAQRSKDVKGEKDMRAVDSSIPKVENKQASIRSILKAGRSSLGSLEGRIMRNGKPLEDAAVYLMDGSMEGFMSNMEDFSLYHAVTGKDGRYVIPGVIPGKYSVALGLWPEQVRNVVLKKENMMVTINNGEKLSQNLDFMPLVQIKEPQGRQKVSSDSLHIQWEAYPGADHYSLIIGANMRDRKGKETGGSAYGERIQNIPEPVYTLPLTGLEGRQLASASYSDDYIAPSNFLGYFHNGAEFFIGVAAYDKNGVRLSDSLGYGTLQDGRKPFIEIDREEKLSEGDRLTMEGKYEDAIKAYEEELKQNPRSETALLSLARIYQLGYKVEKGRPAGGDNTKAADYYGRLLDIHFNPYIAGEAARVLMTQEEFSRAGKLLHKVEATEGFSSYYNYFLALCSLHTGENKEAVKYMDRYLKDQDVLYGAEALMVYLAAGDFQHAVDRLSDYTIKSLRVTGPDGTDKIRGMDLPSLLDKVSSYRKASDSRLSMNQFKQYLLGLLSLQREKRAQTVADFHREELPQGDPLGDILKELAKMYE